MHSHGRKTNALSWNGLHAGFLIAYGNIIFVLFHVNMKFMVEWSDQQKMHHNKYYANFILSYLSASQKTSVSNYQYPEKSIYFTLLNVDSPPCYLPLNFANVKERGFF
ncbi:Uncharacterized protein APZ42_002070 [Daphnia magna]|uniref:Uncharacterized protein n=1 Tax=Daphnia magna TaxID=35525 RepID=A0A164IJ47_9CRUS|nr:Uncharacterized protein APZ42_002070 [Daphnia magna]